jgi:hypothetical protein
MGARFRGEHPSSDCHKRHEVAGSCGGLGSYQSHLDYQTALPISPHLQSLASLRNPLRATPNGLCGISRIIVSIIDLISLAAWPFLFAFLRPRARHIYRCAAGKVDQNDSQDANCPKSGKNAEDAQNSKRRPDFLRDKQRKGHN